MFYLIRLLVLWPALHRVRVNDCLWQFGRVLRFNVAAADPANSLLPVKAILLSSTIAICGLSGINAFSDFGSIAPGVNVLAFWVQTALLLGYVIWLLVFYQRSRP